MDCNNSGADDEFQFFDTRDDLSDMGSSDCCSEDCTSSCRVKTSGLDSFKYEFWTKNISSVHERRHDFVKWLGLGLDQNLSRGEQLEDMGCDRISIGSERSRDSNEAVLRSSEFEDSCCSCRSFLSCQSNGAVEFVVDDESLEEKVECEVRNLDSATEFILDRPGQNGVLSKLRELSSDRSFTFEGIQNTCGSSHLVQQLLRREVDEAKKLRLRNKKVKKGWLTRLRAVGCIPEGKTGGFDSCEKDCTGEAKIQRIRVHSHKKGWKELSSLFVGQDFSAHKGGISTVKFSPDGRYLASAGQDCIVRVWEVIEVERSNEFDIAHVDPLNMYFTVNQLSKLVSLNMDKETSYKMKIVKKSSESACVVFPPKVFRLSETPLHEFQGHNGEVLDLSWSKKKYLLSSSVDRTVRLWQVGCDRCLRIFSHNNYVTCVGFNPVNDNYFISGSIDGKVRIWEVLGCRVVDWIDIREIVTAVCYRPDGKGGIVGSMTGNCRLYDIIDNHLELDAQMCLQGKKKLQGKKITGFQFCPSDLSKVLVTSADSVVRILSRLDVISKFKGLGRNAGSHIAASFTSDGSHVVSASDESSIYVWNYTDQEKTVCKAKKKMTSSESFSSQNASIAIPWCGMNSMLSSPLPSPSFTDGLPKHRLENDKPFFRGSLLESLPKGTATWPEEKIPNANSLAPTLGKSEYRFLKNACHNMSSSSHLWGLVIVTAGWDGRIRTFQNHGVPVRL